MSNEKIQERKRWFALVSAEDAKVPVLSAEEGLRRFVTPKVPVPGSCASQERIRFNDSMDMVAVSLSVATGCKVIWKDETDNTCAVWGDYGRFFIEKP